MRIAICYGLFEGPLCGRLLRKELRRRGHAIVDASHADCIIAHSGAWLMLDNSFNATRILLVDPAYKTNRSIFAKSSARILYDLRHLSLWQYPGYIMRRIYNLWYILAKFGYWLEMRRCYHETDIAPLLKQPYVYLFEASDPAWHDKAVTSTAVNPTIELPGNHDALWHKPQLAADILGL